MRFGEKRGKGEEGKIKSINFLFELKKQKTKNNRKEGGGKYLQSLLQTFFIILKTKEDKKGVILSPKKCLILLLKLLVATFPSLPSSLRELGRKLGKRREEGFFRVSFRVEG